jgi:hypothetical protein
MKKIVIAIALTLALVSCSHSSGYDYHPDVSNEGSEGSDPLTGCGIVQWWESDSWTTDVYGVGRVCVVTDEATIPCVEIQPEEGWDYTDGRWFDENGKPVQRIEEDEAICIPNS